MALEKPDLSKLPPTPLSRAFIEAQEKVVDEPTKETNENQEGEEPNMPEGPQTQENITPVDPSKIMHLKYTRPLPGSYRTFSIDMPTTEDEINNTSIFRAKCLAAIVGEKIFIETVDEHAQDIGVIPGGDKSTNKIEVQEPRDPEDKSTTGKTCDLCGADLVFKKGFNEEKKKPWAAWFCSKAGPDIATALKCTKKPKWVTATK